MQQAALFRRERQVGMVKAVVVVLGFVCDYLRDLRDILGFHLCGLIEYSCVLFSRRLRRLRRRMQLAALYRRERQLGYCSFVVCLRKSARSAGEREVLCYKRSSIY